MALEFKISDFNYPVSILKLRAAFEKNQWHSQEQQRQYQEHLLRNVVTHAYLHVPYYRTLFDKARLKPSDIRSLEHLEKIPILTKKTVRDKFKLLQADNSRKYSPRVVCTSGTTGQRLQFFVDKPSNVLEFVYYWRYWNWAGYRLGDCFCEFSSVFFLQTQDKGSRLVYFQRMTNRLLLNSSTITPSRVDTYVAAIRKHRPKFLKSLPSVLYYFSLSLREKGIDDICFKAVFSTGEILRPRVRTFVSEIFRCKVYNSYGHMERTVAISECPAGGLHINPDYGVSELIRQNEFRSAQPGDGSTSTVSAKIVGTSLHNYSMPLLRYEVGDLVKLDTGKHCPCNRKFPLVNSIEGRHSEVIITPQGGVVTGAFLIFEEIDEILAGQIVQESIAELQLKVVTTRRFSSLHEAALIAALRKLTGSGMTIVLERYEYMDSLMHDGGKFRTVVSKLPKENGSIW